MRYFGNCLVVGGLLLGGLYLLHGFYNLVFSPTGGSDLFRRCFEARQIIAGQSPYDVYAAHYPPIARDIASLTGHQVPPLPEGAAFEPANVPAYPPWALPMLVLTAGVRWPAGRWYFAVLDGLALWLLIAGLRELGAGSRESLAAAMSVSTIGMTLGLGQYGVLVLGLLAAALIADRRGRPILAGACLAASMLKFNITLPFVLVFALKGRWRMLAAASISGAVLMAIGCWSISTGPLAAMRELSLLLSHNLAGGDSLPQAVAQLVGYSDRLVALATTAAFAAGFLALYLRRREPDLVLFALASVVARLSIYHRHYDDLVLVFLLLALLAHAPRSLPARIAFWMVGISLWAPPSLLGRIPALEAVVGYQYLAWVAGAAALLLTSGDRRGVPA